MPKKKRVYIKIILQIDHGTFTPLVFQFMKIWEGNVVHFIHNEPICYQKNVIHQIDNNEVDTEKSMLRCVETQLALLNIFPNSVQEECRIRD